MKKKSKIFTGIFLLIFLSIFLFYFFIAIPNVRSLCKVEVEAVVRDIINESNEVLLSKSILYDEFFNVSYTSDNDICLIRTNNGLINQISMLWSTEIQNRLNNRKEIKIEKPAGAFSGSPFLAQFGATVHLNCHFTSTGKTDYKSLFVQQGINQTLHRLYLYVTVEVKIISPASNDTFNVNDSVLLTESILNGKVPGTYISSAQYTDYLDLLE